MAVIEKRSGQSGVRWRVRIRKAPFPTLTRTFNYKADAEAWAKEMERSLEIGFYDTKPIPITLSEIVKRYVDEISIKKKGYKEERLHLFKI